jgi:hypothetical protein
MPREFLPELEALLDLCGMFGTTEQAAEKHKSGACFVTGLGRTPMALFGNQQ